MVDAILGPAAMDQIARGTRALRLLEADGGDRPHVTFTAVRVPSPIDFVAADGGLATCSFNEQGALDEAPAEVRISTPSHRLGTGQWQPIIVQINGRSRAVGLRRHLARSAARDCHQSTSILRRCKGGVELQEQLVLACRWDTVPYSCQLKARSRYKVDLVVLYIRLVGSRGDCHCARESANPCIHILKGDSLGSMERRIWGLEGPHGLQRVLRIDQARGRQFALKARKLANTAENDLLHLDHGKLRPEHPHEGSQAGDMRRCHRGATERRIFAAGHRGIDVAAGSCDVHRGISKAGETGKLTLHSGRSN
mmetsp:Transcript_19938/g.49777  ORF Transcript_19938/g.49777 Transcript_19938/m.49777 type:complete len:310 (+) Transcript_19938:1519-2448(+)